MIDASWRLYLSDQFLFISSHVILYWFITNDKPCLVSDFSKALLQSSSATSTTEINTTSSTTTVRPCTVKLNRMLDSFHGKDIEGLLLLPMSKSIEQSLKNARSLNSPTTWETGQTARLLVKLEAANGRHAIIFCPGTGRGQFRQICRGN